MSAELGHKTPTQKLAEAFRTSAPASPAIAALAKRMVAAQQPVVDNKGSLSKAVAVLQASRQTHESLSKAFVGNSETTRKAIEQIRSGGIASAAIKEQMAQMSQLG